MFHIRILGCVCVSVCMLPYIKIHYMWIPWRDSTFGSVFSIRLQYTKMTEIIQYFLEYISRDRTTWEVWFDYNNAYGKVVI